MKKKTGPNSSTVRAFVARGLAAQRAVDQVIAAAAAPAADQVAAALERRRLAFAPTSTPADVAEDAERFGAWERCGGGPANDCQAWARAGRGCPRHRKISPPEAVVHRGRRPR